MSEQNQNPYGISVSEKPSWFGFGPTTIEVTVRNTSDTVQPVPRNILIKLKGTSRRIGWEEPLCDRDRNQWLSPQPILVNKFPVDSLTTMEDGAEITFMGAVKRLLLPATSEMCVNICDNIIVLERSSNGTWSPNAKAEAALG